MTDPIRYALND
jgi:N-acetyltransferase 10